jgi:hypothetical protein
MTELPPTVIEPRPCLPQGRIPVVEDIAAAAASKWAAPRSVREVLAVGIVASAVYGVWTPASLLVTVLLGAVLVRAVYREATVTEVLGPYVAAAVGTFGPLAVEMLCADLRRPSRRDRPIGWLLDTWRRGLVAASGPPVECSFGEHSLGCPHCPVTASETDTRCWPAPYNAWLADVRAGGLAR